jgi:DNA-directed RNA polymerase subunit RPC12/RpoP
MMFRCCNCNEVSSAEDINNVTLSECCMNRKQRRMYKPIEKMTADTWYRCPKCGTNIRIKGWNKED